MRFYRYIPILLLGIGLSCISPLDIKTEKEDTLLVVQGFISTLPGPYNIRLTKSAKYGSIFDGIIKRETDAEVWITDNEGRTTFLIDRDFGIYQTPDGFHGEVGKTYVLNIETAVGVHYASLPERIDPVPKMDSIYFEYKRQPSSDSLDFRSGVDVYGVWQDPPDQSNYYIWRNSGVYVIETFPENYTIPGPPPRVPAPKDCCKICWVSEINADFGISIFKDNNTNGMLNNQFLAFIEDNGKRFYHRYKISIDHLSISREAYQFFNLLKSQKSINGDIFDPPPATIRGNILNLDDPESNAVGYFHASDGYQISGFIDREELQDVKRQVIFNDDCRVIIGSTDIEPDDWE